MAITIVFPQIFPGNPWRSMEKFLRHLRQLPAITNTCDALEHHRIFQTHRDYPPGTPASNWMSTWLADDREIVTYHYGTFGQSVKMPEGARAPPPEFPITMDWYVDPLFVLRRWGPGTAIDYIFTSIARH